MIAPRPISAELTLWNYRCFGDAAPVNFTIGPGATAIVGTNNSGKSAFLRFFYELRPLLHEIGASPHVWLSGNPRSPRPIGLNLPAEVPDPHAMFHYGNDRPMRLRIRVDPAGTKPVKNTEHATEVEFSVARGSPNASLTAIQPGVADSVSHVATVNDTIVLEGPEWKYDVGLIRGAARALADSVYIPSFRNAINVGQNEKYFDINTGQAFAVQWRNMLQGQNVAGNRAATAVSRVIGELLGFKSFQIVSNDGTTGMRVLVNDEWFGLDEIGSGIAQLILVLCNAAVRKPSFILIDEPELSLHPSLQIDFLTKLAKYAQQGIIFATHSYGLARAAAVRTYAVKREAGQSTLARWEKAHGLAELLGSLNYAGYSQLGFETVLLVEGPTDVLVALQWLSKFGKAHKVVVLPLGGRGMISGTDHVQHQLGEVRRICPKVAALIDSERDGPGKALDPKRQAFVEVCGALGIACHATERRATEHYFPDEVIKRVWGDKYRALGPHEDFATLQPGWSKADNWRLADQMTRDQLAKTDLGPLFENL